MASPGNPRVKYLNPFYDPDNPEAYHYNPETGLKRCTRCGEFKPISEFYKTKRGSKDGYFAFCKTCNTKQVGLYFKRKREEEAQYKAERAKRKEFEKQRKAEREARKEEDRKIFIENRRKRKEHIKWVKSKNKRWEKRRRLRIKEEHKAMLREISLLRKQQQVINAERRKHFYELYPDELFTSFRDLEKRGFIF